MNPKAGSGILAILVVLGIAGLAFYYFVLRKRPGTVAFAQQKGTNILASTPAQQGAAALLNDGISTYNQLAGLIGTPVAGTGKVNTMPLTPVVVNDAFARITAKFQRPF